MSASTIRIWLEGPLQSWGSQSMFEERATGSSPTKSGVVGMIANAMGRSRDEDVSDIAGLRFGARAWGAGSVLVDFHTAGADAEGRGVALAGGGKGRLIVTRRTYLVDSAFVVGLEAADRSLLDELHAGLREPARPLFLGRRSCPPCGPLVDSASIVEAGLVEALEEAWIPEGAAERSRSPADHFDIEDASGAMSLNDQISSQGFAARDFSERRFERVWSPLPQEEDK